MMVAGFVRPDGGASWSTARTSPRCRRKSAALAWCFRTTRSFPHLNVFENVAFPLRARHWAKDAVGERVTWALDLVRLGRFADRDARQLSGGQQQRVALARAIVFHPPVVLMDEPLGALDKNLRFEMQVEIKEIQQRLGMTVLYVTHDQEEAMSMSDRIAIMNHGRIDQVGPPGEVYERPANPFVGRFLGEANLIEGTVMAEGGEIARLRLPSGQELRAPRGNSCGRAGDAVHPARAGRDCAGHAARPPTRAPTRSPEGFAAARFSATSCATRWSSTAPRRSRRSAERRRRRAAAVGAPVVLRWPVADSLILAAEACGRAMTVTAAALTPASRAAPKAPRDRTLLLMLPALAMLIVMFLVPLVLFFVRTFAEFDGTTAEFIDQAQDLLLSQPYLTALGTTNWISLIVTVTVLLIGYPIAYYLTTATGIGVRIVVLSIVLPYFTSIIVRTFSWMVLLGEHGLVNNTS
jgi:ABC-type nitrate/sulfonate/bicarbonate transport system ATPase subunit